jgi:KDO2-lipid IV(A) lauroyltransferase
LRSFIAQIPKNQLLFFGKILGNLLYYLAAPQRRVVMRNLQFSHIESSPQQIQSLAKRIFQHFGTTILELLQMTCFSQKELLANLHIENKEILIEALARQRGVVLVSAHLGNYELAWQYIPCYLGHQMVGVAKKMRNVRLDRLIHQIRTRFGNRILYKKGALPEMMQTLRQGEIVGILMDISRRFDGVEVTFLGAPGNRHSGSRPAGTSM